MRVSTDLMRIEVYIHFLYPGMILKGDGYDENENKVIKKGIPLTYNQILNLKLKGIKKIYYARERLKLKNSVSKAMISDENLEKAISLVEDIKGHIRSEGTKGTLPLHEVEEVVKNFISDIKDNADAYLNLLDLYHFSDYTYTHSINVATISVLLGVSMNLSFEKIRTAGIAGLLHDIGKIMLPEAIVEKPSDLTDEEWKIMKNHPVYSYNIIKAEKSFGKIIENAILLHHENYTGNGYPFGINYEKQNIFSHILSLADVFDAMTSKRPYKEAFSFNETFAFFMENSGKKFNPAVAQIFLRDMAKKINEEPLYPIDSFVQLNTGEIAHVVGHRVSPYSLRPIVNIFISPTAKGRGIDRYLLKHPMQIDLESDYTRYIVKRIMDQNQINVFKNLLFG